MRRRRATHSALALLLCLGLASGNPLAAQSPRAPAGVVAALSLDPPEATPPIGPPPTAGPSKPVRLRTGGVPAECEALLALDDPTAVDCWLRHFPKVAGAIRWEFVGARGRRVLAWPEWDEEARGSVRVAFAAARRWKAGGMKGWTAPMASEPPINREAPHVDDRSVATVFDGGTAWILFSSHVGLSLAAEMGGWMPWSIRGYDAAALADLYDASESMFIYDREDGGPDDTVFPGYAARGVVTPTHPTVSYRFLHDRGLLRDSPLATITAVLEWSRRHLTLAFHLGDPAAHLPRKHHQAYWHYAGKAPLVSILSGTRLADAEWQKEFPRPPLPPRPQHWTAGCAMTTDAYTWLLRVANVPVRRAGARATCGHVAPYFSSEGLYLSHGDDAYDEMVKTASFSTELLLVRAPMWKAWFPDGEGTAWCWNVGRRVQDLNINLPSEHLVGEHCEDVLNATPRDESRVLSAFRNLYTLDQLEKAHLWSRLSDRALASKMESCVRLRSGR